MSALRDFVADLLELEGAAIEPVEPDALEVLAPDELRGEFRWPEQVCLGFGAARPAGALAVGLDGDWLGKFGAALRERGHFAARALVLTHQVPAPSTPERVLERGLDLPNAVARLIGVTPTWARCLLLTFRYSAVSDEKRDGLVCLGFNQDTGAVLDDIDGKIRALLGAEAEWRPPEPAILAETGPAWDFARLERRLSPVLDARTRRELAPFLRSMRRRLDRDRGRVHAYHAELRLLALKKLGALGNQTGDRAESDRKRETMRIAAIEREYAAKLEDLRHNYALRVSVEWVQAIEVFAPVHRFEVLIKRRKRERRVLVDWHSATKCLEPAPVDWGDGGERVRFVCDEQLHMVEAAGQAPCPGCGRSWCRACAAACPRCGR